MAASCGSSCRDSYGGTRAGAEQVAAGSNRISKVSAKKPQIAEGSGADPLSEGELLLLAVRARIGGPSAGADIRLSAEAAKLADDLVKVLESESQIGILPHTLRQVSAMFASGLDHLLVGIGAAEKRGETGLAVNLYESIFDIGLLDFLNKFGFKDTAYNSIMAAVIFHAEHTYALSMPTLYKHIMAVADLLGVPDDKQDRFFTHVLSFAELTPEILKAAGSELADRRGLSVEQKQAARAAPRLKWGKDNAPDENPAAFAWRAYQAEAEAGTLHRGVIAQEDKPLSVKLANWLRTHPMPEGIDIPTLPEWNTRQLAKLNGAPRAMRTEEGRLHEAARYRAARSRLALTRT